MGEARWALTCAREEWNCKKYVLKIQEYIPEGANLKFYIPEFSILSY
jgi:hypothetical protein